MFENVFSQEGTYAKVMNWLWDVLVLSVLLVLFSLPVFTAGAAGTAAYYAAAKSIRHKTGKVHSEFFRSFRSNFRQSIPLTLGMELILVILGAECIYFYADSTVSLPVLILFLALFLCAVAMVSYLWACLSRFSMGSMRLFRMSLVLTFRHFITTAWLLVFVGLAVVGVFFLPWGILLFPGCALYGMTFPMEKILKKYSPPVIPGDPEADKWYNQ